MKLTKPKMIQLAEPIITSAEQKAVQKVLASGMLAQGHVVAQFEQKFARLCGTRYAVAVNNGTAALHTALYAFGIKEGDEVITTPFTFVATANAILMQKATPVFVDIEPVTYALDPQKIEEKITQKTKAILPVDLYGHLFDVPNIKKIARKHKLAIIEDSCQAHGATYKNQRAGSCGDIGCFSFYATKNMTTGEGGMLVTNNKMAADQARRFRHHGQSPDVSYRYECLGYNYRMTDLQAAIGIEQLKQLPSFNKKRIANAEKLSQGLKTIKGIITPQVRKNYTHVFHQYTIRITNEYTRSRDALSAHLLERGIGNAIFYPTPLHLCPQFQKFGYKKGDCPIAERISQEVLSLPVNPRATGTQIKYIINTITSA